MGGDERRWEEKGVMVDKRLSCQHSSSTLDLHLLRISILSDTFLDAQNSNNGITDEVLLFKRESGIDILNHGDELLASVGALVDEDQVFGFGKGDAGREGGDEAGNVGCRRIVRGVF